MTRAIEGRNGEIWQLFSAGMAQGALAEKYGISQQRVSQIITSARAQVPDRTRAAVLAELLESIDLVRTEATKMTLAAPVPVVAGKDAIPVPAFAEDGTLHPTRIAEDHSGRTEGMSILLRAVAQQAKMLGLNAPDKVETDSTIHYVIEGVDTDKL